jgi:hypothetical protein
MLVMHSDILVVGEWDEVWEDHAGIWVRGRLCDRFFEANVDELIRDYPEISVSWVCTHDSQKSRRWREAHTSTMPVIIGPGDNLGIAEASFVDRGSFAGTWWKIIGRS